VTYLNLHPHEEWWSVPGLQLTVLSLFKCHCDHFTKTNEVSKLRPWIQNENEFTDSTIHHIPVLCWTYSPFLSREKYSNKSLRRCYPLDLTQTITNTFRSLMDCHIIRIISRVQKRRRYSHCVFFRLISLMSANCSTSVQSHFLISDVMS